VRPRGNILYLAHRVPFPPNKGDKIRTFHQLKYLAARHNVYCACFVDSLADEVHAIALREWCVDVIAIPWNRRIALRRAAAAFLTGRSLTCATYDEPEMWRRLRRWSRQTRFNAVVAFSACMAPYAWSFPARRRVLDLCDVDSRKWLDYASASCFPISFAYRAEARRLAAFERRCINHFDATILATQRERESIDPNREHRSLFVVANGVDSPASPLQRPSAAVPVVTFVGAMNYRPNVDGAVWFVGHVWPRIKREVPDARFIIAGANPARAVQRLARIDGVTVTGEVRIARQKTSRVVIAPMPIVRGIPNKVLEAMAYARPVVAAPEVAEALGAEAGLHLLTAGLASDFADRVLDLLRRDAYCDLIAAAGRRFVAAFHNWRPILNEFESLVIGAEHVRRIIQPSYKPMRQQRPQHICVP
jgi:sugar transferase (PEP-CTERM/EpsH1 system associated)